MQMQRKLGLPLTMRKYISHMKVKNFNKIFIRTIVSIDEAKKMAKTYNELPNEALHMMAASGDQEAREERLIREIMSVDHLEWIDAQRKFLEIQRANRELPVRLYSIPYILGLSVYVGIGVISIPLIFHYPSVVFFNEHFVTADIPEPKDLETWLEVGSWSWNWMEPVIGELSFLILCSQLAVIQLQLLKWDPYDKAVMRIRATRLHLRYPQYSKMILMDFARYDEFFTG